MENILQLKVSDKKKNKEWYREVLEYYIPYSSNVVVKDQTEIINLYKLLNNDLTGFTKELEKFCNPLESFDITQILPYNKIKNKLEVLIGEVLKKSNDHKVVLLSDNAKKEKNEQLVQKIMENVHNQLVQNLEQMREQLAQIPPEEADNLIKQMEQKLTPPDINHKNYMSELEIINSKLLKYTYHTQDIKLKKADTMKDTAISDRFFVYPGWKNGKPQIIICNVVNCLFNKSANEPYVQKGDYFAHVDEITKGQLMDEYGEILSQEELENLVGFVSTGIVKGKGVKDGLKFDHSNFYATVHGIGNDSQLAGLFQENSTSINANNEFVRRVHLEFKAWKEVIFYTYPDEYNEHVTIVLNSSTDIIPENATEVSYTNQYFQKSKMWVWVDAFGNEHNVKILWIPRRYEVTRLANDTLVNYREVPFQPDYIVNPIDDFELTYKGGVFNNRNAKFFSLVQNALPYYFQILSIKMIQNQLMAKYEGNVISQDIDQIPDELTLDENGNPLTNVDKYTNHAQIRRKTGVNFFSGSQNSNGLPNNQRTRSLDVIQLGTSSELINFENLIQMLDLELGLAMGVPPSREAQVMRNTNVTDNQQSLIQSALVTEAYFFWHNKIWASVLNEHLKNLFTDLRLYFFKNPDKKETIYEYFLPDGTSDVLKITPNHLQASDVGIFLQENSQEQVYLNMLTQKIMQNTVDTNTMDSMSAVLKAISSGSSVEEIDKLIRIEADKIRQMQEQRMQQEQAIQAELEEKQINLMKMEKELDHDYKIAELLIQKDTRIEEANIKVNLFALEKDINQDMINDDIEMENIRTESKEKIEKDKLAFEREKLKKMIELEKLKNRTKPKK